MPTVARLTLQVDADGVAETAAELEALDRLLKSRAASWSQLASRMVVSTDEESGSLVRLARTAEDSHGRAGRAAEDSGRRHARFGGVLGVLGQQMTRISARATIFANALIPLAVAGFQVGSALTPIVGLAGAIPGLLVAGGTAAATAGLAFHGMGDALDAMAKAQDGSKASAEALAEAMSHLPPAARPVVRQLFEMRGMVTRLRETAAAGVMPGVADLLRGLGGLFPIVQRHIAGTSREMGLLAQRLGVLVRLRSFQADLNTTMSLGSVLTRNFGNAGIYLAQAFMDVAVVGRPLVVQFGRLVELTARSVEQFTDNARASGAMARFFSAAGQTAEDLFSIVSDLVVIIFNLGRAAAPAGAGLLEMLRGLLDRAARATQNIDRLRAVLQRVGDAFVIVRTAMLGVAFGPWGAAAGLVAGVLLVLYRRSEAFRNAVNQVGQVIARTALPMIRDLGRWLGGVLLPAIQRTIPFVREQFAGAFAELNRALGENRGQLQQVGSIIVRVAGWILVNLLPALIRMGAIWGATLVRNIAMAIRIFGAVVNAIRTVVDIVRTVIGAIQGFVQGTQRAWTALVTSTQGSFNRVGGIISGIGQTVSRIWNGILGVTRAVWGFIRANVFDNIARVRAEVVKSIVGLIPRWVRDAWTNTQRTTSTLWGRIRDAVADTIRRLLANIGQAIVGLIPRQVRDGWNAALRATRDAWGAIRSAVTDGTRRALSTISGWGASVRRFFSDMIRDATSWGRRIWDNIRRGIASIDLAGAARSAMNRAIGIINGFGAAVARGANIILPGSPIQWSGIPLLRQAGGEIPGPARGDRVPVLAEGGEVMIRQPVAGPLRSFLLAINRLPASMARALGRELAGTSTPDVGGDVARMILSRDTMSRPDRQGMTVPLGFAAGGEIPRISGLISRVQSWIRAQDPKPYIWGGGGPGGYDCSGITGAVYAALTGRSYGGGQRYFTTQSNFPGIGFRPGRGTYTIGVNRAGGHMAGNLAGLPFEARSRASGILTGPAARSVTSFPQTYYLPQVGGRFIGGGGGIDFLGLLGRLVNRLLRPVLGRLSAWGTGPDDMVGSIIRAMGGNVVDQVADYVKGGVGLQWGGDITEPIVGMGRRSGGIYHFGERGAIERYRPAGAAAGGAVYNINVSLTGTYAEPITMDDVHRAIGSAVGMLRSLQAKTTGMGRS